MLLQAALLSILAATNWPGDVRVFARELPKRHANAFHNISKPQFDAAVAELEAKAATASDSEMYVGLLRITAMVGDAHTYARIPQNTQRFPIGITRFGDEYRVTHALEKYRAALGKRVVKINDTDVAAAGEKLGTLASQAETPAVIRDVAPWLSNGTLLHGLGITKAADRATYTFDDDSTLEPQSVPWYDKVEWVFAREITPLSAQKPGEGFWFTWLEPEKSVYVAFRSYEDLRARSRELWKLVDAHPTAKVIFDLRNSPGGDYTEGRSYIVEQVKRRPKLKTYALVGVRTFSAAMNNAIDLRNAGATLVGNTIGERPNSYQENDDFTLPSSKILISYSTRFYKFLPEGVPNVVEPDHRVEPSWDDYKAGRDAALEWILADR